MPHIKLDLFTFLTRALTPDTTLVAFGFNMVNGFVIFVLDGKREIATIKIVENLSKVDSLSSLSPVNLHLWSVKTPNSALHLSDHFKAHVIVIEKIGTFHLERSTVTW